MAAYKVRVPKYAGGWDEERIVNLDCARRRVWKIVDVEGSRREGGSPGCRLEGTQKRWIHQSTLKMRRRSLVCIGWEVRS